jgi:hypothetical protein
VLIGKGHLMGMKCLILNNEQVVLDLCNSSEIVPSPSSVSSFEKNVLIFHK